MALTLEDIDDLEKLARDPIHVGTIPYEVARKIGLKNSNAYLSLIGLSHIRREHPKTTNFDLLLFPFVIAKGLIYREDKKGIEYLVCNYLDPLTDKRYVVPLEMAENRTQLWARSFYRVRKRQTKAKLVRAIELLKGQDRK